MVLTAVEFAAGMGHHQYPLLSPRYSPSSRVPCVDFSPWLREQIARGDAEAVAAYVLQVVQANPGMALEVTFDSGVSPEEEDWAGPGDDQPGWVSIDWLTESSAFWVQEWTGWVRPFLESPLEHVSRLDLEAELDLRALVVMNRVHGGLDRFALLSEDTARLAAAMAPHDVWLVDPEGAAQRVNAIIAEMAADPVIGDTWAAMPKWSARSLTPSEANAPPVIASAARLKSSDGWLS